RHRGVDARHQRGADLFLQVVAIGELGRRPRRLLARNQNELMAARFDDAATEGCRPHFSALHQRRRSGGLPDSSSARAAIASVNLPRCDAAIFAPPDIVVNKVGWNGITLFGLTSTTCCNSCRVTACRPPSP